MSAFTINLTVKEKPNYTPKFNSATATTFFNMQAGDTLYIPLSAVDTNRLDILTLDTVYTSIPNRLPLPEITRASGSDSVRTFLKWVLDCSLISDQAYTIKIGAWDNACRLIADSARYQFTVKVNRNPNLVPYFPFATGDTVIKLVAGEKFELDLTSASATPGDSIEIATSGDVYGGIPGNLATFEQTVTTGTAKAMFRWETSCDQIRDDVYTAVFKTANPPCLTDTNTYTIRFKVIPNTDIPEEIASIFVEASPSSGGSMRQDVRLPVSQITITVMTRALVLAEDILNTDAITSGDPDLRQEFLLVQLDRKAAIDVMNYTKEAKGRRFVLIVNDAAVGFMPIEQQIVDGNLMFHVEKKGLSNTEAVMDISRRLNISALKLRKLKEDERK